MRVAFVDDDPNELKILHTYFNDLTDPSTISIDDFSSGEEFLSRFTAGLYDLVVLDIFMGDLTGVDVARKIRETDHNVRLVFCTTSNDFASESYEVAACYYLHKPYTEANVESMLDRLNLEELERTRSLSLPDGQSVLLRDIIYADYTSHRMVFHCKKGGDIVSRLSFAEVEPKLCAYPYFYSSSRGIILNFYEVIMRKDDIFIMSNGSYLPISRRKAKNVISAYSSFRFQQLRKGGIV